MKNYITRVILVTVQLKVELLLKLRMMFIIIVTFFLNCSIMILEFAKQT